MAATTIFDSGSLAVVDYRCAAGPRDTPFLERHAACSLAYVRKGSFGYRSRGRSFELVAGAVLLGAPGDEYMCTHDHVVGDECLSLRLGDEALDATGAGAAVFRIGAVPPVPELMVLGELLQASAEGANDLGLDEAAILFAARVAEVASGRRAPPVAIQPRDRRRPLEAAARGAPPRRRGDLDHRRRLRRRIWRRVELHPLLPPRRRGVAAPLPAGRPGRSQDPPRSPGFRRRRMKRNKEVSWSTTSD